MKAIVIHAPRDLRIEERFQLLNRIGTFFNAAEVDGLHGMHKGKLGVAVADGRDVRHDQAIDQV